MMNPSRILVVDNNPIILKLVGINLRARNFDCITVEDGESALRLMAQDPVDLVVLDIMMPGIDGFEVCRCIRERSTVPVIMLSLKEHEKDMARAFDVGADDYVTKPFDVGELMAHIRSLLFQSRLEHVLIDH